MEPVGEDIGLMTGMGGCRRAQLKAVCVEAGMLALREGAKELNHEHFHGYVTDGNVSLFETPLTFPGARPYSGILEVQAKKKNDHFVSPTADVFLIPHCLELTALLPQYFA